MRCQSCFISWGHICLNGTVTPKHWSFEPDAPVTRAQPRPKHRREPELAGAHSISRTLHSIGAYKSQNSVRFAIKGALAYRVSSFPKYFLFASLCSYVCRLCINFEDLCARLLGMAALRILLLTFTSRFVIDFLSIRKVIIFSAMDRHPLWSRFIHQNAANCMTIRYCYIAQPRGVRKNYCARSRNDVRCLSSRSNGMPSKKIMESSSY